MNVAVMRADELYVDVGSRSTRDEMRGQPVPKGVFIL